ncbi:MAG: gamma-glutamyltransferase, partial [Cyanobacteriota bacterium]
YGRLPLRQVLAPAIALAEQGFPVGLELSDSLLRARTTLQADPGSRSLFFRPSPTGLRPLAPGERLRQPQLAASLARIASGGAAGFYEGPVADSLLQLMEQRGGLIQRDDLSRYRARLVPPLMGRFRGHLVLTMPPPGGGLTLLQLLALLEPFDLAAAGLNGAASLHPMVEAMNLAFRDRNARLGDPEQQEIPVQALLERPYLDSLRRQINPRRHRPAARIGPAPALPGEGTHTTHLSVADRQGGLVALTTTLNFPYGNGVLVPGGGFLLNNEMDDFSTAPGQANAFGLVQGPANRIAPGRRPLSSMSPTLVLRGDQTPWLATGSPGGSRIITTVLQVLLNRMVHGLNLATAVSSPRLHSQLWPDQISVEEGFSPDTLQLLKAKGHRWQLVPALGSANSVEVLAPGPGARGGTYGMADPRRAAGPAVGE